MIEMRDGAKIPLHTTGSGPDLLVVHGGGVTIDIYRRLAARLADRFTVHLYNRRGRADAPPRSVPYSIQEDVDDLAQVLAHTGAVNVLGHSGGAVVAIEAARQQVPMRRLAVYDVPLPVDGLFPTDWLPAAQAAARAGDTARALALTGAGLNTQSAAGKLPIRVQVAITKMFLRTPIGRTMGDLVAMTLDESAAIRDLIGPASRWAGITAETLLVCGASGPPYYPKIHGALAAAIPNARALEIPSSTHDGLARATPKVVEPFAEFFADR
ncbi:alpha/beta fold hydrolase [Actinoplanes sichuanensis]|uniref:Alpha/beta fold hydrolase n=1 Tax=Actinoplanes sichuanensis TaxID=512349 RepID=A0ABW4AB81_9ACTN|nr:alpha/beta fold hydrolase [Actinoplanes sichuanensis]BEL08577.1 alpha/beta fold hydrolase [Actinoplanes sichuanensis]